jgi:predicted transcriptional regulator of viral defense system
MASTKSAAPMLSTFTVMMTRSLLVSTSIIPDCSGKRILEELISYLLKHLNKRLGSARKLKIAKGIEILMASRARALMDAVYDWSRYNTIPRVYGWIASSLKAEAGLAKDLISVTFKYGNKATIRRIGYLLTLCGIRDNQLDQLQKKLRSSKSFIPWIPGRGRKGSINKDWGVIVNGTPPG